MWASKRSKQVKKTFTPVNLTNASQKELVSLIKQQTSNFINPNIHDYIRYYSQIEPCSDAIDRICDACEMIESSVKDANDFVEIPEFDQFIQSPNPLIGWPALKNNLVHFYLIMGNSFIITTRSSSGKLLEMYVAPPQYITTNIKTGLFVEEYFYTPYSTLPGTLRFGYEEIDNKVRYLTQDGTKELFHWRHFNPNDLPTRSWGQSPLHSAIFPLETDKYGSLHNLSLLKNGARIGGIYMLDEELTADQCQEARSLIQNTHVGARNAGTPLITNGLKDYKSTIQTNKDMDYSKLESVARHRIYNRLRIPIALIDSNSLSLSNMEQAETQFYKQAVCPVLEKMNNFLTVIFSCYFNNFEGKKVTYDPFKIDALRRGTVNEIVQEASINVLTDNELRNKIDEPPHPDGDKIWKPTNTMVADDAGKTNNTEVNE